MAATALAIQQFTTLSEEECDVRIRAAKAALGERLGATRDADEAERLWTGWHDQGAAMRNDYERFVDLGGGGKDFSGIIKMIDDSWKAPEQDQG